MCFILYHSNDMSMLILRIKKEGEREKERILDAFIYCTFIFCKNCIKQGSAIFCLPLAHNKTTPSIESNSEVADFRIQKTWGIPMGMLLGSNQFTLNLCPREA